MISKDSNKERKKTYLGFIVFTLGHLNIKLLEGLQSEP